MTDLTDEELAFLIETVTVMRGDDGRLMIKDVNGCVAGFVNGCIYGNVYGDVRGTVFGSVEGDVLGCVVGKIGAEVPPA